MPANRTKPTPFPPTPPDSLTWTHLYNQFGERVFRLLHRLTRNPDLAADLTHDTFVRVFAKTDHLRPDTPVEAWIFSIAANLARDHARRNRSWLPRLRVLQSEADRSRRATGAGPETRLALAAALDRLPEPHRVALLLHDVDGFTHQEIARMLQIAPGTSKARVSRGRAMLRQALGADSKG